MESYFHEVVDLLTSLLVGDERFLASFSGEDSDFVRFNRGEVRQAGTVSQRYLEIDLIEGRRHASCELSLAGDRETDRARLRGAVEALRATRPYLPEDPHLLYAEHAPSSEQIHRGRLPDGPAAAAAVQAIGAHHDLVGIYAAGPIHSGFASSFGQRNWHSTESFHLDFSLYQEADRAVKTSYSGFVWEPAELERKARLATEQLATLARPPRTLHPGRYRVFLAPAALGEIVEVLSWSGFSLRAARTKTTPLLRLLEREVALSPLIDITENTHEGVAPNFQESGFIRPDRVPLVRGGELVSSLVSPRSAAEYGVPTNGATAAETPCSIDLGCGRLPTDDALARLGTGLYVSNLWYCNFSDRSACRTTGMTRFATFWVQNGELIEPVSVMRFDETIYRMLGENLIDLTAERELIMAADTYESRSVQSARLPGALIDDFTLTL
ncbi:MAG: metallopeptidase TldD-related protein [bacterium]